jgi:hypothetical protein
MTGKFSELRAKMILLTIKAYQKMTGGHESIVDLLAMPGVEDIEFDPPRLLGPRARKIGDENG